MSGIGKIRPPGPDFYRLERAIATSIATAPFALVRNDKALRSRYKKSKIKNQRFISGSKQHHPRRNYDEEKTDSPAPGRYYGSLFQHAFRCPGRRSFH
jgi:hypothetical protein